jgi:hypothetical protein
MREKMEADRNAELSRRYERDGSVRPAQDTGYRVGMAWRSFVAANN